MEQQNFLKFEIVNKKMAVYWTQQKKPRFKIFLNAFNLYEVKFK